MRKTDILIICFLFFSFVTFAQAPDVPVITTAEQNQKWLWDLEILTLKEQITKIQKRIIADSNFYETKRNQLINTFPAQVQPIYQIDNATLTICRGTSKEVLASLSDILHTVISVKVLQDGQAGALYGQRGKEGGVILMNTNSDRTADKLRKLNLTEASCTD